MNILQAFKHFVLRYGANNNLRWTDGQMYGRPENTLPPQPSGGDKRRELFTENIRSLFSSEVVEILPH